MDNSQALVRDLNDSVLSARSVSVMFDGLKALSDVSLSIERGQVVGLIGPNGAGKTTLVNTLTGFSRPTSGAVCLGQRSYSGASPHRIRRSGIARTFQAGRLFSGLHVIDNLAVTGVGMGHSRWTSDIEARRILDWMGAGHLCDLPAQGLPYTDERRVGIARALMHSPSHLLLDEPAAGMSEKEAGDLSRIIHRAAKELGCGVMLIEHNVGLVLEVCQHVYVLDTGRLIAEGDREAILSNPLVREAYLGTVTPESH